MHSCIFTPSDSMCFFNIIVDSVNFTTLGIHIEYTVSHIRASSTLYLKSGSCKLHNYVTKDVLSFSSVSFTLV